MLDRGAKRVTALYSTGLQRVTGGRGQPYWPRLSDANIVLVAVEPFLSLDLTGSYYTPEQAYGNERN